MKKQAGLAAVLLLTGCSALQTVKDYNEELTDYTGTNRIGMAFDIGYNQVRVYQQTGACIDLYSKNNRFIPAGFSQNTSLRDRKRIGMPEAEGMSPRRNEYWLNSDGEMAIRVLYVGETGNQGYFKQKVAVSESLVAFKPEPGAFYYVTIDDIGSSRYANKELHLYKIADNGSGKKELKPVEEHKIYNCAGKKPWYLRNGAVI